MLKSARKHRPKQLLAVYVEPRQVEVLRAHRQWRSWQVDSVEQFNVPEGENIFDYLQRLNLRSKDRKGAALVLFLPLTYYSLHREHYPVSLKDQLDEALSFDWQENLFYEHDRTVHFAGPAVPVNKHLSVPIFTMQKDVYDKFHQVTGGGTFQHFTIIPSALAYSSSFGALLSEESPLPIEIIGRIVDRQQLEIHRFYNGLLLDSMLIGSQPDNLRLFRENLRCIGDGVCQEDLHIHLLCSDGECAETYGEEWKTADLSLQFHPVGDSLISRWVDHLFTQEQVQTFDTELLLKPWKIPKATWPILLLLGLYSAFAAYEVASFNRLQEQDRRLKKQTSQLETQWKPIEQLQNRIAKFQEDQKTLTEFNAEGYPLLEILTILTQVTPDDTWLNYLSLRKGQLMLRGESKSAIKYLSELSKVDGFGDVRFASPVTRNPASDLERFNVQLQVDFEKLKKTIEAMPAEALANDGPVEQKDPLRVSPSPQLDPEQALPDDEVLAEDPPEEEAPEGE